MEVYSITVGFFPTLYCWPNVTTIGEPFKCHEVLSVEPTIPPTSLGIFLRDWGILRRSRCVQILLLKTSILDLGSPVSPRDRDDGIDDHASFLRLYMDHGSCFKTWELENVGQRAYEGKEKVTNDKWMDG